MNLVTTYFNEPIIIEENKINVIVIENVVYFSKFIAELNDDINGITKNFYISKNLTELNLSKISVLIIDVFNFSINKNAINKIYKLIESNINEDALQLEKLRSLNSQIYSFLDELIYDFNIDLKIDEEYSLSSLFKMSNLKVEEEFLNVYDKILNIIKVISNLDLYKIIFFVNLKDFVNTEQLIEIYKLANYNKVSLVLIENKVKFKLPEEKYNILDEDLCEII